MQKITLASKALFDFDKAVLKPEGMAAIDSQIIAKLADVQKLELVLVTGHTDRIGSQAYNQKLSERRADAVRNYLVSKGVAKDKIETLGMGKTQPVPGVTCTMTAMKALIECLAPNRRVEVEVKGEAIKQITPARYLEKAPLSRGFFSPGFRFRVTLHACRPATFASTPAGSCRSSPPERSPITRCWSTRAASSPSCRRRARIASSARASMSRCRATRCCPASSTPIRTPR